MRQIPAVLSLVLLAPSAFAGAPASDAARPIVVTIDSDRCQAVSEIPRSTRTAEPAYSARVSLASCMASAKLEKLPLTDNEASIERANVAIAPMLAALDEVVAEGDPYAQLVAAYTKGDLLFGLQQRLRDAVPPITQQMSLSTIKDIEQRHRALEPRLSQWGKDGTTSFLRVLATARENPKLSHDNPVVHYMVRDAERRLTS